MSVFEKFEKLVVVAFLMARHCGAVIFRYGAVLPIIQRVTEGKLTTQMPICLKEMIVGVDSKSLAAITAREFESLRRLGTSGSENRSDFVFVGKSKISGEVVKSGVGNCLEILDFADFEGIVKNLSIAKAFVSYDNEDEVIAAFWMPKESPLIVIVPPKRKKGSRALDRLTATGRKIVRVEGEVDGAVSQKPELFAKCVDGEVDADSDECASAFANLSFSVNHTKVVEVLRTIASA
jgi:hypothetical protein